MRAACVGRQCHLTHALCTWTLRFTGLASSSNHCSDDRALEAGGPLKGIVLSLALLREIREPLSSEPRNDPNSSVSDMQLQDIAVPESAR